LTFHYISHWPDYMRNVSEILAPQLEGLGYCVGEIDVKEAMELPEGEKSPPEENLIILWRKERDGFRFVAMFSSLGTARKAINDVAKADFEGIEARQHPAGTLDDDFRPFIGEPEIHKD